jgi:hypothetical protein
MHDNVSLTGIVDLYSIARHRNVKPCPDDESLLLLPVPKSGMTGCSVLTGDCAAFLAAPPSPLPNKPPNQPPPAALPLAGGVLAFVEAAGSTPKMDVGGASASSSTGITGGAVDEAGIFVCARPAGLCVSMSSNPGGGGGAVSLVIIIPMPSMPASSTPPNTALRPALAKPCRSCVAKIAEDGASVDAHSICHASGHLTTRNTRHVVPHTCRKPPVNAPDAMAFHGSSCGSAAVATLGCGLGARVPHQEGFTGS